VLPSRKAPEETLGGLDKDSLRELIGSFTFQHLSTLLAIFDVEFKELPQGQPPGAEPGARIGRASKSVSSLQASALDTGPLVL
jgi:hypothetical protein